MHAPPYPDRLCLNSYTEGLLVQLMWTTSQMIAISLLQVWKIHTEQEMRIALFWIFYLFGKGIFTSYNKQYRTKIELYLHSNELPFRRSRREFRNDTFYFSMLLFEFFYTIRRCFLFLQWETYWPYIKLMFVATTITINWSFLLQNGNRKLQRQNSDYGILSRCPLSFLSYYKWNIRIALTVVCRYDCQRVNKTLTHTSSSSAVSLYFTETY